MIDLPHVASRVFGTPLMIARPKLEVILGVLAPRLTGALSEVPKVEAAPTAKASIAPGSIAIVPIVGTLVSRSGYLDTASGLLSYGDVGATIASAVDDPNVRGVILDLDSPGGEVGGLFDLVEQIGAIRQATDKPLWAVANEGALSAAYAIASTADRLYVTRTGEVGSIGVVAVHVDESEADAKAGLAWSFVFAGARKVDGNSHEPLSECARETIQADVERLYGEFCTIVATNRRLTAEAVRDTQAAVYRGELAVRAGLADRVGTLEVALSDMAAELDVPVFQPANTNPKSNRSLSMAKPQTQTEDAPEPVAQPPAAQTLPGPEGPEASPPATRASEAPIDPAVPDPTAKLRAEFAEIAALAAQATRLGVNVDAADAVRKGISPDALRRSILDALASRSEATSVIAAAPSTSAPADSPIVRRAKERAAAARA